MIESLIKIIFPPKCIFCGTLLSPDSGLEICGSCYDRIPFISITHEKLLKTYGYLDDVICTCEYSGIIKESLIRYKFFDKSSYYRTFAQLLAQKVKKMTNYHEFDIITGVPLHKDREKKRGYNQSILISKILGRETGIREKPNLLKRIRSTNSQSLLSKDERCLNVKGAFSVSDAAQLHDKSILLVDDVMTTGSTLEECARVLKDSGARSVTAAVIASGRKF
ncbi:MAG TPA: ComF family protein [Clostridia bacterium]|nr:ComF family protein [Clostridia bacterium]